MDWTIMPHEGGRRTEEDAEQLRALAVRLAEAIELARLAGEVSIIEKLEAAEVYLKSLFPEDRIPDLHRN